jgi:hypothetical protein
LEIVTINPQSLTELIADLMWISGHCKAMEAAGYDGHTKDFTYRYYLGEMIGKSHISCPICKDFYYRRGLFSGDELKTVFSAEYWLTVGEVDYPNVHASYSASNGVWTRECGCELRLENPAEAVERILADEIRVTIP